MTGEQAFEPIPITKPFFGPAEMAAVQRPLETGWVVQGPYVREFEQKFERFTGCSHAVATSSCTTALHIAMAMLDLKPGDEVIVPAFTWVATANVVEYMGATPVFCDIELPTFNLDVSQIESLITPRTVGIIPVHLFGLCVDMEPILELACKHHLWVVEDAACAFGAWRCGRHAGVFGDIGCFSFHPRKSITTGEGGMLTTADDTQAQLARSLRDHGASRTDLARHTDKAGFLLAEYNHLGYNYRMTDIQGALGSVQMDRAEFILAERTKRAHHYDELLAGVEWLKPPVTPEHCVHGYQAYVCLFQPEEPAMKTVERLHEQRNTLMADLEAQGIAVRQGTHAPVILGYYVEKYGLRPEQFPNAYLADRLSLALPLYVQLTAENQARVVAAAKNLFGA
jgi:dTDP-4-amino-4,6-dideoxygalactose transaminase